MPHLLIVSANFYEDISAELLTGAKAALDEAGAGYQVIEVPGALEIPPAIRLLSESGKYDGYVALGCVIRGETTHYETVCNESARGLMDLGVHYALPIGNGILTVENEEQASVRASVSHGNKGAWAAEAALKLIALKK